MRMPVHHYAARTPPGIAAFVRRPNEVEQGQRPRDRCGRRRRCAGWAVRRAGKPHGPDRGPDRQKKRYAPDPGWRAGRWRPDPLVCPHFCTYTSARLRLLIKPCFQQFIDQLRQILLRLSLEQDALHTFMRMPVHHYGARTPPGSLRLPGGRPIVRLISGGGGGGSASLSGGGASFSLASTPENLLLPLMREAPSRRPRMPAKRARPAGHSPD